MDRKHDEATRDAIFLGSSLAFNILVSLVYIYSGLDQLQVVRVLGIPLMLLFFPFLYTLIRFIRDGAAKRIVVSNALILVYILVEFLLDYVLLVPFREVLVMHAAYILVFYAAEFSIIGVSFRLHKRIGFVILFTFFVLLGSLAFSYM